MSQYVIDRRRDRHHDEDVWCVWELVQSDEPILRGEFDSLASAKASLNVVWSPPDSPEQGDWDYIGRPVDEADEEYTTEGGSERV